ncbi:MAG: hypothetical protein E7392_00575 [Ruminococcaceae bacterium]|nr:hypothetical protein [Oscillospiraceae bacterium]
MKERIYSIPLTEALEENCGCILCTLEKRLEEQACEYFLGPSMMEPDSREITNEKGFCRRHMRMLFDRNNRLSLALMLETHVKETQNKLTVKKDKGLLNKKSAAFLTGEDIYSITKSCALCDKLNSQMYAAAGNLAYLWSCEDDFRKKFESTGGLCLEHTALVLSACDNELHSKKKDEFIKLLISMQQEELSRLYDNLHAFTISFDYRNAGKELSQNEKESVHTAIKHLTKY